MDVPLRKVTARVDLKPGRSRPASPTKLSSTSSLSPPPFHPRAKLTGNAPLRKLSSSSSLSTSRVNHVSVSSHSRPGSPQRPSRMLPNGSEPSSSPKARIAARPTSRSSMSPILTNLGSPEHRQRALTSASAKLKLANSEERPRSGSVIALDHACSVSDLNSSSSPASQPSPLAEAPLVDTARTNTPQALPPFKIKSKITSFIKSTSASAGDSVSRSLSPPYATTRPIHTRSRAPSITSSFSLNDPPSSTFYPITVSTSAANPHRYAPPRRAPSPARPYTSPAFPSEAYLVKKSTFVPKVDPASIPLPPHSPPISALSLSSKSSVSKTSDQTADNPILSVVSHFQHRSNERMSQSNLFFPQPDIKTRTNRDRSRSKERSPRDHVHSDAESEGSEHQLRTEAKTNRKIADLEITNRSLLTINASLETSKNLQAKEIRDLRRKLRESRLILPPRTYKAAVTTMEDEGDEEDEGSDVDEGEDETFQRVRDLIDSLIVSGKRALEMRPEDVRANLATKVLNADELRSWRDSGQRVSMRDGLADKHDADDETSHPSTMVVAMPDSGCMSSVENDALHSPGCSPLPPITITHSL